MPSATPSRHRSIRGPPQTRSAKNVSAKPIKQSTFANSTRELTPTEARCSTKAVQSAVHPAASDGPSSLHTKVEYTQPNEVFAKNFYSVYEELARIGKGGSGYVYEVRKWQARAGSTRLACKVIDCTRDFNGMRIEVPEPESQTLRDIWARKELQKGVERMTNEVVLWKDFNHPHLVKLLQSFRHGEYKIFLIMPLASWSLANYPLKISFDQAFILISQIMDATIYMHENNCTHRDLKPANILLSGSGEDLKAMVADFGISEKGETHVSKSGTQGFRAPEVLIEPTHDNKVDAWAIGLILWGMLFGPTYFVEDLSKGSNTINWDVIKTKKAEEAKGKKAKAKGASNKVWLQGDRRLAQRTALLNAKCEVDCENSPAALLDSECRSNYRIRSPLSNGRRGIHSLIRHPSYKAHSRRSWDQFKDTCFEVFQTKTGGFVIGDRFSSGHTSRRLRTEQ
ncbi:hypothetical protein FRB95_012099 [Tulasnella sp. JGI-2019a]|nr:hypothetical protein FRB95_012099 [Tulasnella sp. JGI-2019a]